MAAAAAMDFLFLSLTSIAVTRHNINWTKVRTKVNHVAAAATLLLLLLLPLHCFVVFVVDVFCFLLWSSPVDPRTVLSLELAEKHSRRLQRR